MIEGLKIINNKGIFMLQRKCSLHCHWSIDNNLCIAGKSWWQRN